MTYKISDLGYALLRIYAALCVAVSVAVIVALSLLLISSPFETLSLFLSPGLGSGDIAHLETMDEPSEKPFIDLIRPAALLAAAVCFILCFIMSFGSPKGGRVPVLLIFEKPRELFQKVRAGSYSVKALIALTLLISIASALFSVVSDYLYFEACLGWLKDVGQISETVPNSYLPQLSSWAARFVSYLVIGIIHPFVQPFFIYWIVRLLGRKTEYPNLYALTVYVSLVPLAVLAASVSAGSAAYYVTGKTSAVSMAFLPYIGSLLSCGVLAYGIRDVCGLSLKKSLLAVSPIILIIMAAIYIKYALLFVVPERILQLTLYQLGVYGIG